MKYYCEFCDFRTVREKKIKLHYYNYHRNFKNNNKIRKVFSFSLHSPNEKICSNIIKNIEFIRNYYYKWEVFVHYSNIPKKILDLLKFYDCHLIDCNDLKYKYELLIKRFFLFNQKYIDVWISRSLESKITDKEMELIKEWIDSPYAFYIIDKSSTNKIFGENFGVKNYFFNKINFKEVIENFKENYEKKFINIYYFYLEKYIWPKISKNNLIHKLNNIT